MRKRVLGAEAVSEVWRLTKKRYGLSGQEPPKYPRSEIPVRFVRNPRKKRRPV